MPAFSTNYRSVQTLLATNFFASTGRPVGKTSSHAALAVILLLAFAIFSGSVYFRTVPTRTDAAKWQNFNRLMGVATSNESVIPAVQDRPAEVDKGFYVVYNPPFKYSSLDSDQRQNVDLVDDVPNRPEQYGLDLLGLPSLGLTVNERQVFDDLAATEGSLRQFELDGSVKVSEAGCLGLTQGCDFNICPEEFWRELYTNIWCGAKAFKEQLRIWKDDFTYAVVGYKGAWFYSRDSDGNILKSDDGSWNIIRDDAGNLRIDPEKQYQVDRVFNNLTIVPVQ